MSEFTFNQNIPASQNNPSSDQPKMLANNIASFGIIEVDHVGYNSPNGGIHQQTSFEVYATPILPSGDTATAPSVSYPAAGQADSSHAQYYFQNPIGTFPLSAIKAFGTFLSVTTVGTFPITISPTNPPSTYNVVSITKTSGSTYNIQLTPNIVTGSNPTIFVLSNSAQTEPSYSYTGNIVTLTGFAPIGPEQVNFLVLQI